MLDGDWLSIAKLELDGVVSAPLTVLLFAAATLSFGALGMAVKTILSGLGLAIAMWRFAAMAAGRAAMVAAAGATSFLNVVWHFAAPIWAQWMLAMPLATCLGLAVAAVKGADGDAHMDLTIPHTPPIMLN